MLVKKVRTHNFFITSIMCSSPKPANNLTTSACIIYLIVKDGNIILSNQFYYYKNIDRSILGAIVF